MITIADIIPSLTPFSQKKLYRGFVVKHFTQDSMTLSSDFDKSPICVSRM